MERIARNLKILRLINNITLTQMADATGICEASIWNYENGTRSIPAERVIVLAEYFNVDLKNLMLLSVNENGDFYE